MLNEDHDTEEIIEKNTVHGRSHEWRPKWWAVEKPGYNDTRDTPRTLESKCAEKVACDKWFNDGNTQRARSHDKQFTCWEVDSQFQWWLKKQIWSRHETIKLQLWRLNHKHQRTDWESQNAKVKRKHRLWCNIPVSDCDSFNNNSDNHMRTCKKKE